MRERFFLRLSGDQPMNVSLHPICRGDDAHAIQAIGLSPVKTIYYGCGDVYQTHLKGILIVA
jgi:hypothetical protein